MACPDPDADLQQANSGLSTQDQCSTEVSAVLGRCVCACVCVRTRRCRAEVVEALKHHEVAALSSHRQAERFLKPGQVRREPLCPHLLANLPHQLGGGRQISPDGNVCPAKTAQQLPLCLSAPPDAEEDPGSTTSESALAVGLAVPVSTSNLF